VPFDLGKQVVARAILDHWPPSNALWTCQGAKRLLTCMRALPGDGHTTSVLAFIRPRRSTRQSLMVTAEEQAGRVTGLAGADYQELREHPGCS
jgi:hypothetical protein